MQSNHCHLNRKIVCENQFRLIIFINKRYILLLRLIKFEIQFILSIKKTLI